jgi:cytochrome c5
MKKYIYSLCLLGVIVYSCKTQTTTPTVTTPTVSTATANLTKEEMLKKGEDLFNLKCGRCHGLPSPSEFTIADWQPIMARMAPKAKLNAEETNWVLAYVNANAKK